MDSEGHCKLIDFGTSQAFKQRQWYPNEDYPNEKPSRITNHFESDFVKLGQMTYQMLTGVPMNYFRVEKGKTAQNIKETVQRDLKEKKYQMSQEANDIVYELMYFIFYNLRMHPNTPDNSGYYSYFEPFFDNKYLVLIHRIKKKRFFDKFDWENFENGNLKPPFKPTASSSFNNVKR